MGRLLKMAVSAALMLVLTLAGCGGSNAKSKSSSTAASSSQTTSPAAATPTGTQTSAGTPGTAQAAKAGQTLKVVIPMSSTAFSPGSNIPVRYTCDGAGTSPPLHWGAVPKGTVQLALFILGNNGEPVGKQLIYWAVAGLDPTLKSISAGALPPGAIVGRNSLGLSRYTICPAKSQGQRHYAVALLALSRPVAATPGFNASALFEAMRQAAEYAGLTTFTYQRR